MSEYHRLIIVLLLTALSLGGVPLLAWPWQWRRFALAGATAGWFAILSLLVVNGLAVGALPFGNMYQVMVVLALCFVPLWALLAWRRGWGWMLPFFSLAQSIFLIGALCMDKDLGWSRIPALQSAWFVPHVIAYMLGYALCAVAFLMQTLAWIRPRHPEPLAAIPDLLRLAFAGLTFGMLSGALWAEDAWGAYWSWDAKETWSLITWLGYAIYLHAVQDPAQQRWRSTIHVLAFLALLTTFILVNVLPKLGSALHGYA